ncbi:FAM73B, partial [Cordylochernes scorpioides]
MAREALKWKDSSHDLSEQCTFYSANSEIANIHDFDDEDEIVDDYLMYKKALKLLETEMVPCRISRTALLKCPSETDFLAKLHCIRQAFPLVFELEENVKWFTEVGRSMLVDLFTFAKKDPKGCVGAYEEFLRFTAKPENWPLIEDELADRGLTCFTFYDTVLDFIILDAFEDLENPPSSVNAVIQNRWLSSGFKESALGTAVWSVLKAKRRLLRYSKGFISHFYSITEYLSPTLAWGFFGPNEELKEICLYFKEEVVGFISDIFSLDKVRYTSPQELAVDIMAVARE